CRRTLGASASHSGLQDSVESRHWEFSPRTPPAVPPNFGLCGTHSIDVDPKRGLSLYPADLVTITILMECSVNMDTSGGKPKGCKIPAHTIVVKNHGGESRGVGAPRDYGGATRQEPPGFDDQGASCMEGAGERRAEALFIGRQNDHSAE